MTRALFVSPSFRAALGTLLLLLVPLVAMQFTTEVSWGPGDFLAAAALLFTSGMAYSLLARRVQTARQRLVVGVVVFTVLGAVWAELAIGLFS